MKIITLKIDDNIIDHFNWLLSHFSAHEINILTQSDVINDDVYLRSIEGMVASIQAARLEPIELRNCTLSFNTPTYAKRYTII